MEHVRKQHTDQAYNEGFDQEVLQVLRIASTIIFQFLHLHLRMRSSASLSSSSNRRPIEIDDVCCRIITIIIIGTIDCNNIIYYIGGIVEKMKSIAIIDIVKKGTIILQ